MHEKKLALLIGNSDGIGLALTRDLLHRGCRVVGVSRSPSPLQDEYYVHEVADVQDETYSDRLAGLIATHGIPHLCVYCAGIGELLDVSRIETEVAVMQVNLTGMVRTVAAALPGMVERGSGHLIGLSSVADEMLSAEAPSYHASKAGFSCYLESLALAMTPRGVRVTNIRFGFVDTKMAKGDVKPFMMSVDRAVEHILRCIDKHPIRYTAPKVVVPLVKLRAWMLRCKV